MKIETVYDTGYVQGYDHTIIYESKYKVLDNEEKELISTEIISWYYGEAQEEITNKFIQTHLSEGTQLKAVFI